MVACGTQRIQHPIASAPGVQRETAADRQAIRAMDAVVRAELRELDKGDPDLIIEDLETAIATFPQATSLYLALAQQYIRQQQWTLAQAAVDQAVRESPDDVAAHLLHARLLLFRDERSEAIAELETLRRQHPREEEIYTTLARLYIQEQQYRQGERIMRQLQQVDPDSLTAYYYLGTLYGMHMQRPQEAIQMFRRLIHLQPGNVPARKALAQMYLNAERLREALTEFLEMERYAAGDVDVQLRIAVLHYELREYREAIARLERVLIKHPKAHKLRYYLGVIHEEAGDDVQAIAVYATIPAHSKYFNDAILRRAAHAVEAKAWSDAIAVLEFALRHKKGVPEFYQYLAFLHQQAGNAHEAARILRRAIRTLPERDRPYYDLAILYDTMQQSPKAVQMMLEVLKQNPKHVKALNYVGYTYVEWGRHLDEAERLLQEAIAVEPENGHVLDSLGWLYHRKGEPTKALTLLERAHELLSSEPTIMRHLAEVLIALGETTEARQWLTKALRSARQLGTAGATEVGNIERILHTLSV